MDAEEIALGEFEHGDLAAGFEAAVLRWPGRNDDADEGTSSSKERMVLNAFAV